MTLSDFKPHSGTDCNYCLSDSAGQQQMTKIKRPLGRG